jgi:hypothetical protein
VITECNVWTVSAETSNRGAHRFNLLTILNYKRVGVCHFWHLDAYGLVKRIRTLIDSARKKRPLTLHAFIRYCGAPLLCEGVGVCDIGVGFSDALDGVGTWVTGCVVVPECETGVCETG